MKLVISDDHKGLKAAATRILGATWQRCRVHFARNLLAHAGRQGRRVVSAFVATAFAQERRQREGPVASGRRPAQAQGPQARRPDGRSRARRPRLHELPQGAPPEVAFDQPDQRLHAEVKRRTNVVGIFPNEDAITRLSAPSFSSRTRVGRLKEYMTLESIAPLGDGVPITLPTVAA